MSIDTSNRLAEIRDELADILEKRLGELMTTMKDTEQVTRQIVSTELEISRYRRMREQLSDEIGELNEEVEALTSRTDEVRTQHAALRQTRDRLREELQHLERSVRETDTEAESNRVKLAALNGESESLQAENVDLKTKIKTMEENVSRMRALKEELMHSISGLTAQMAGLTGLGGDKR